MTRDQLERFKQPSAAPGKRPYSPGIRIGDWSYLSGHVPVDDSGACAAQSVESQTYLILRNLENALSAVGGSRADFVSTAVFLTDIREIDEVDAAYREFFDRDLYPTRTTVQIAALGRPEFKVEISAVAYTPPASSQ
jgi:2-iminobutanoate/2-iminopropanoate deaminase